MSRHVENRKLERGLLVCALATALLITGGLRAASAEDDDEDTIDTKFFRGILTGLGLKNPNEPGIDYHERSPLVVPPTRDLPAPESGQTAAKDPAWPKDADVARRKASKRKSTLGTTEAEQEDMRQLRPDELDRKAPQSARTTTATMPATDTTGQQLKPSELGFSGFSLGSIFNRGAEAVPFTGEPPRTSLTDPPPGLRTPSPRYTYGTKGGLEPTGKQENDQAVFGADK